MGYRQRPPRPTRPHRLPWIRVIKHEDLVDLVVTLQLPSPTQLQQPYLNCLTLLGCPVRDKRTPDRAPEAPAQTRPTEAATVDTRRPRLTQSVLEPTISLELLRRRALDKESRTMAGLASRQH